MQNEKFIPSFIKFIEDNFEKKEHLFIIFNELPESKHPIEPKENIIFLSQNLGSILNIFKVSKILKPYFIQANIVIIHSFFIGNIVNFLFLNQKFLQKSNWVIWGADLYDYQNKTETYRNKFSMFRKKSIIKKLHGLITYVKGDYELAKKWYGATGKYYECFMYPSNLYKEYDIKQRAHDTINIQVGNSADPSNNHIEVFEKLIKLKDENIKIYAPLSYGNPEYAQQIISIGNDMFGDKFIAMTEFMAFDKYLDFLADIDIAIFNHKRQQAMGNTITLLGLGKKVYIRSDVTPWKMFEEVGIKVFDVANIELSELEQATKQQNMERVQEQFSKENLVKQLETICR